MKLRYLFYIAALGILAGLLLAAQTPEAIKTEKAPVLNDTLRMRYWKANSEYQQAQVAADAKRQSLMQIVEEMRTICGKDFQPTPDKFGDPECSAKPPEAVKK